MADYILTTKQIHFAGFEVVDSVSKVTNLTVNSILIVESYRDTDFDFASFIVKSARSVMFQKIAYISSEPVSIILEVMKVLKAFIIQDGSLIETQEGLSSLFTILTDSSQAGYHTDELEEVSNNLLVVDNFISEMVSTQPKASQRMVKSAWGYLTETVDKVIMSDELRNQIQEFLFLFTNRMSFLEGELKRTEDELNNLKASRSSNFDDFGEYMQYTYTGNARVLLVKEHVPTKYLTSYLIAFLSWLTQTKDVRAKLLIIDRDTPAVESRYKSIPKVDIQSIARKAASFVLSPVLYTVTPVNVVMKTLMEPDIGAYIVLDRTYKADNIVTGRGIRVVHAVSSRRLMRELNLDSSSTILNELGDRSQLSSIGFIEQYPRDEGSRVSLQQSAFESGMIRMAEVLGYH